MTVPATLLELQDLRVRFATDAGDAVAVDGVSLAIHPGEAVGLVGESGCGKSVTALSVLRLIAPPGEIVSGRALFRDVDLLRLTEAELRAVRGRRIALVFQEPATALNPVLPVGEQIAELLRHHLSLSRRAAEERVLELLRAVGLSSPAQRARQYPHELSGGMRQRVVLAMAIACEPELLIADEPTSALDATVQAQILALLEELRRTRRMALLLISHDLGVVARACDRLAVMYAGRIVERGEVAQLLRAPAHPYTAGLMRSARAIAQPGAMLAPIPGAAPPLARVLAGCRFRPRCDRAVAECASVEPALAPRRPDHEVACLAPLD